MIIVSGYMAIYHNQAVFITFYFGAFFQKELPWQGCDNEWKTELCSELQWDYVDYSAINATWGVNSTLNIR